MEVVPPLGSSGNASVNDLCWKSEESLVALQRWDDQLLAFSLDVNKKTYNSRIVDSGFEGLSVSCSPDGKVYVAEGSTLLRRYYPTWGLDRWNPSQGYKVNTVASNQDFVVTMGIFAGSGSLYDQKYKYIRHLNIADNKYHLFYTRLTPEGLFLATTWSEGHHVIVSNVTGGLEADISQVFGGEGSGDGQLSFPGGIDITPEGNILVSDRGNDRISQFSTDGEFIDHLEFEGAPLWQPRAISVLPRSDKPSLLAVTSANDVNIKIYVLGNSVANVIYPISMSLVAPAIILSRFLFFNV